MDMKRQFPVLVWCLALTLALGGCMGAKKAGKVAAQPPKAAAPAKQAAPAVKKTVVAKKAPAAKKAVPPVPVSDTVAVVKPAAEKKVRPAAPDFTLQDLRQDQVTLSSYKGKNPVLLFFWTTWCPFCQRELQVMSSSYGQLASDGVEFLAVDIGELPDKVSATVDSYNLSFRVLLDKDSSVSLAQGVIGVPTYILVNKDGLVVFKDNYFPTDYKDLLKG